VVRDQKYEPADFKRAVQLWGELQPHDKKDHHIPGFPEMYYVTNQEFLGDRRMIPGETFHTDHSNHPAPPKATILYPVALPSRGGDTQYVNMHQAYDELSEAMKRKIDELMTHATQKRYEYRHQWQYGDMVMWYNRSVMHKANPDYDMNEKRYLYRLMLKGEPPVPVAQAA